MTTLRITTVTVLSMVVGLLVGVGAMALLAREASAGHIEAGGSQPGTVFINDSSQSGAKVNMAADVGVGGSFVTAVYEKVSPAVVHITNRSQGFDLFRRPVQTEATGSGVIVDEAGYILTNFHVIQDAAEIVVVLNDGREFKAKIIGQDPGTDLALLKVDAGANLPTATLGDSSALKVGEWVVAIGNPEGLDWTVTVGVVSALGREIASKTGQTLRGMIQTDAAINPGNSGGPLLDAAGEVIGINDAIVSNTGENIGIGLAIPINTAKDVLQDLIKFGRVKRPWLGMEVGVISKAQAVQWKLPVDYGIVPLTVYEDSPAARAGIIPLAGDRRTGQSRFMILTGVNGKKISSDRELLDIVRNLKTGDTIRVDLYSVDVYSRSDVRSTPHQVQVKLDELPTNAPLMGII